MGSLSRSEAEVVLVVVGIIPLWQFESAKPSNIEYRFGAITHAFYRCFREQAFETWFR